MGWSISRTWMCWSKDTASATSRCGCTWITRRHRSRKRWLQGQDWQQSTYNILIHELRRCNKATYACTVDWEFPKLSSGALTSIPMRIASTIILIAKSGIWTLHMGIIHLFFQVLWVIRACIIGEVNCPNGTRRREKFEIETRKQATVERAVRESFYMTNHQELTVTCTTCPRAVRKWNRCSGRGWAATV